MKKLNLWLLMSLFAAAFTLSACGSDDDDKPTNANQLVGTWKWNPGTGESGQATSIETLTFGNDNSFKRVEELMNGNQLHVRWINQGTYVLLEGNKATITVNKTYGQNPDDPEPWEAGGAEEPFTVTYRIDGNKMYYTRYQGIELGPFIKQ